MKTYYKNLFFGLRFCYEADHSNGFGILKSYYWSLEKQESNYLAFKKDELHISYRRLIEFCVIKNKTRHEKVGFEISTGRSRYPMVSLALWRYEFFLTIMDLFNE